MKLLTKSEKIELIAIFVLFILAISSLTGFAKSCEKISSEVLRLHVIANSDSSTDQALKLKVRDAVLAAGEELFDGSVTADEARATITPKISELKSAAENVLLENGCDDKVSLCVTEEYFATRVYENFTMPAGKYHAVRIVIGEGEGQNWWCVMFPPLCLPAASAEASADAFFDGNEMKVLSADPGYEPRFKIVEIINRISERLEKANYK